ncbi:MAG: CRTAC1 family protein [Pirellulaceae bacterium]|nr:CRTAC1 family protein [Pirellulaceae bacterium]
MRNHNFETPRRAFVSDWAPTPCQLTRPFLCCTAALFVLLGCDRPDPVGGDVLPGASLDEPSALVEITREVGVDFVHDAGPIGDYSMPQIMGSGAAMFDFDGDSDLDILLINGGSPARTATNRQRKNEVTSHLYRQEPDGAFVDVTGSSQLLNYGYGMGTAVGDIDNDGDLDVYVTNYGSDCLFQNNGDGTFANITESAGIENPSWGTAACFFDHDRDGWLDLFVVNYLDYFPGSICEDGSGRRDYCGPESFGGTVDSLHRNTTGDSDGHDVSFMDVTVTSGLASHVGRGLGLLCRDLNDDGRADIYVANDMEPNRLWIQREDGTYSDEAMLRGVAVNRLGRPEASMGLARGDFDGDGSQDLFVTHLRGETNTLYMSEQTGLFADITSSSGLGPVSLRYTGFGVTAVDLEHDGDLDVVVVNGGVKRGPRVEAGRGPEHWAQYAEPNQLFFNTGNGSFVENAEARTAAFQQPVEVSRGLVRGDIDNDGDIDLLVTNAGGPARLYRNDFAKRGNWLQIHVVDPSLRRDSIGARVMVQAGGRQFKREVSSASSYLCSHDLRVHFGLGNAPQYDEIAVQWPGAGPIIELFPGGESNRSFVLTRGTGRTTQQESSRATQPSGQTR